MRSKRSPGETRVSRKRDFQMLTGAAVAEAAFDGLCG
jgi:hypothetical protein